MFDIVCFVLCIIGALVAADIGRRMYWGEIELPSWIQPISFIVFMSLGVVAVYIADRIWEII